jgi:5-formyltetrahydrofolate cyclo-ligase
VDTKQTIRRRLLAMRDALSRSTVDEISLRIQEKALSLKSISEAVKLALYSPIRNEVETGRLFLELRKKGKKVFFPRMFSGMKGEIEFCEVSDLSDLVSGPGGILEPKEKNALLVEELDLVILPGVAFDEKGSRLGFGKGFYDKALKNFAGVKVGLAYEFQVVPEVPVEAWDVRCDGMVTEKRSIVVLR